MSFRQKEDSRALLEQAKQSQKKQEMFRLVYPELVQGLNKTKEGYVIPTKGGLESFARTGEAISVKKRDVSACLP